MEESRKRELLFSEVYMIGWNLEIYNSMLKYKETLEWPRKDKFFLGESRNRELLLSEMYMIGWYLEIYNSMLKYKETFEWSRKDKVFWENRGIENYILVKFIWLVDI